MKYFNAAIKAFADYNENPFDLSTHKVTFVGRIAGKYSKRKKHEC